MTGIAAEIGGYRPSGRATLSGDWPVILGLAVLVLAIWGVSFGNPVAEFDDQLYSFIGWRMLHGELPFVDWHDRKPFGLFAIFALAHAIGGPGPLAYQLLAAAATLGGAVLTFTLARPLADRAGAAIAGAFYVVLMAAYSGSSGQSEAFHVPMMLAAVLLVRDPWSKSATRRALFAMAICGLALQVKYTVLPQCLFLGLWALWGEHRRGAGARKLALMAAVFIALGLAPTAAVALFYWMAGGWDAFVFANFVSFFLREGAFPSRFHSGQSLWLVPLAMPLAAGIYSALRIAPPRNLPLYWFYAGWFASTVATVLLPKTLYLFYLGALVPGALLLAAPLFDRRSLAGLAPGIAMLAFLLAVFDLPGKYHTASLERNGIDRFASAIAPHVDGNGNCLFVFDGPTVLYRLTGGCAPSRFVYPDHLNNALETNALPVSQAGEVARILATRPGVIVTANWPVIRQNEESLTLVEAEVQKNYRPLASTRVNRRTITAWARRDL